MAIVEAVTSDERETGDETPGIEPNVAFEHDANIVVRALVTGGTESGWHHHGDRHVYGYLLAGEAAFEYGRGGEDRTDLTVGDFFHLTPGAIHRDINPGDAEQVFILNVVGSGPLVVNVEGPNSG